jgi:hypothetical protein
LLFSFALLSPPWLHILTDILGAPFGRSSFFRSALRRFPSPSLPFSRVHANLLVVVIL